MQTEKISKVSQQIMDSLDIRIEDMEELVQNLQENIKSFKRKVCKMIDFLQKFSFNIWK